MIAPSLELLVPLRQTILADTSIVTQLSVHNGEPSVHTRRPVPEDVDTPFIAIGPIVTRENEDGINDFQPVVTIDIVIYGDQPVHYRLVESVADSLFRLFHRRRHSIIVNNYSVTSIRCTGPTVAPADDERKVGRRVSLRIQLAALAAA